MTTQAQHRAVAAHRARLADRGLIRFEVTAREVDRTLIRTLARRLAEDDALAARMREDLARSIAAPPDQRGGILAALRRSPLVGAGLDLTREPSVDRIVDL